MFLFQPEKLGFHLLSPFESQLMAIYFIPFVSFQLEWNRMQWIVFECEVGITTSYWTLKESYLLNIIVDFNKSERSLDKGNKETR